MGSWPVVNHSSRHRPKISSLIVRRIMTGGQLPPSNRTSRERKKGRENARNLNLARLARVRRPEELASIVDVARRSVGRALDVGRKHGRGQDQQSVGEAVVEQLLDERDRVGCRARRGGGRRSREARVVLEVDLDPLHGERCERIGRG